MSNIDHIRSWIAARPFTAVGLSAYFGITAALAGCRDDWFVYMFAMFLAGVMTMVLSMLHYSTLIKLVLCAALTISAMPDVKAQEEQRVEPAGALGVAVVVVVVGGVCVYLLVRTCQRLFPKTPAPETNGPPYLGTINGRPDDTAGSWSYYSPVSCYVPQSEEQWPNVTMELTGTIEEGPTFQLEGSRRITGNEAFQDYDSFQSDLARHGITIGPIGSMYYGRNGRPAYEQETNIRFSEVNGEHIVSVNSDTAPSVPIAIQRSYDLKTWTEFGHVLVPIGSKFKLMDTTSKQSVFYRIQAP